MSNDNHNLMEEWKALREEIVGKQDFHQRLILTVVAGNLAIYSFALRDLAPWNAFIALVPIVLSTMAYFWILKDLYSIVRISKYIKEYIEPKTDLYWETWVQLSRRETEPRGKMGINIFSLIYHTFYVVSLFIYFVIIWAPSLLQSGSPIQGSSGAMQLIQTSLNVRIVLTIGAILIAGVWYILVKRLWVSTEIKDIERINRELQMEGIQRNESNA